MERGKIEEKVLGFVAEKVGIVGEAIDAEQQQGGAAQEKWIANEQTAKPVAPVDRSRGWQYGFGKGGAETCSGLASSCIN